MFTVAIVGTVGVPANYGGFETLVENLIEKVDSNEFKFTVFCSEKEYSNKLKTYKGANLIYIPLRANGIQSIFYDALSMLIASTKKFDCILILGVSGSLYLPILKRTTKARIVTNIDGMEWKRNKWSFFAKSFLRISEKFAVCFSDSVIADNQGIANYVKHKYGTNTYVIPYGGDHAIRQNNTKIFSNYALSLCRIEPENNVELILEAFSKEKYHLKFIGNWNSSQYGKNLKKTFKKCNNIELIDPIYDLEKLFVIRNNCNFYVHGHSAGGTNPSLVEMMHFGIEVYAYDCNYNRFTTESKAKFFKNVTDLRALIKLHKEPILVLNSSLKEIAIRRYTWEKVTAQYIKIFQP